MAYFDQAFGAGTQTGGLDLQSLLASLKSGGMGGGPVLPQVQRSATNVTPAAFPGATQPAAGTTNPTAQLDLLQKLLASRGGGGLSGLFSGLGGIGSGGGYGSSYGSGGPGPGTGGLY